MVAPACWASFTVRTNDSRVPWAPACLQVVEEHAHELRRQRDDLPLQVGEAADRPALS